MKKIVLITGANGEVAKHLSELLKTDYTIRFLTRKKQRENEFEWNIETQTVDIKALEGVNHIIHLAGAGIADERWTEKRKQIIISSRIDSARLLLNSLKKNNLWIDSFISASAVGYYGMQTSEKIYMENDSPGNDFLSEVCIRWEQAADDFINENIAGKVAKIRLGVVLSNAPKGVLERVKKPISLYVGSCLGSGNQYMPWIHIEDLCRIFKYSVENPAISGIYNGVAPESVTNGQFTRILAEILQKPLLLPPIPGFLLKAFLGEAAGMLLEGSQVSSSKIQNTGFKFHYPLLKKAITSLL